MRAKLKALRNYEGMGSYGFWAVYALTISPFYLMALAIMRYGIPWANRREDILLDPNFVMFGLHSFAPGNVRHINNQSVFDRAPFWQRYNESVVDWRMNGGLPVYIKNHTNRIIPLVCNDAFTMEATMKKEYMNLTEEQENDQLINKLMFLHTDRRRNIHYKLGNDQVQVLHFGVASTENTHWRNHLRECVLQGLPRTNASDATSQASINMKKLQEAGVALATATAAFHWDNTAKVYYPLDSPTLLADVCVNADSCVLKPDIYDIVNEMDVRIDDLMLRDRRTARGYLFSTNDHKKKRYRHEAQSWLIYVCLLYGMSLYSPPPIGLGFICNRWVIRAVCIFFWYWTLFDGTMAVYNNLKDVCFNNDRFNPDAGKMIQEYVPGFSCQWLWNTDTVCNRFLMTMFTISAVYFDKVKSESERCFKFVERGMNLSLPTYKITIMLVFFMLPLVAVYTKTLIMTGFINYAYPREPRDQIQYWIPQNFTFYNINAASIWEQNFFLTFFRYLMGTWFIEQAWLMVLLSVYVVNCGVITTKPERILLANKGIAITVILSNLPWGIVMNITFKNLVVQQLLWGKCGTMKYGWKVCSTEFIFFQVQTAYKTVALMGWIFMWWKLVATVEELLGTANRLVYQILRWATILIISLIFGAYFVYFFTCKLQPTWIFNHIVAIQRLTTVKGLSLLENPVLKSNVAATTTNVANRLNWDYKCTLGSWAHNLPTGSSDKIKEMYPDTHYNEWYIYGFGTTAWTNFESNGLEPELQSEAIVHNNTFPSTYAERLPLTLLYNMFQMSSTAGFGDIPPTLPTERLIASVFSFAIAIFFDTIFLNIWCAKIQDFGEQKSPFIRSAVGMLLSNTRKDFQHRIERSQSYLCLQWNKWNGLMPLSPTAEDLDSLPHSVRQEVTYSVLYQLLMEHKSTLLGKLNSSEIRHLSDGLEYHIIQQGDIIPNSVECQDYVLIIFAGSLYMESKTGEFIGELRPGTIHFEVECFLGSTSSTNVVGFSEHSDVFIIPRHHFMHVIHSHKNLHDSIVEYTNNIGKARPYEQIGESEHTLHSCDTAFHGLTAPVLSKKPSHFTTIVDILAYLKNSKSFNARHETLLNPEEVDTSICSLVQMAEKNVERAQLNSSHAYNRCLARLKETSVLNNAVMTAEKHEEDMANRHQDQTTVNRASILQAQHKAQEVRQRFTSFKVPSLQKVASLVGLGSFVESQISQPAFPVDSNLHTDVDNIQHGNIDKAHSVDPKVIDRPAGAFHENDPLVQLWHSVFAIYCFFAFLLTTYQYAFWPRDRSFGSVMFVNYLFVEAIAIVNFLMKLKTGVLDPSNVVTWDKDIIWAKMDKSMLQIDAIAMIPLEVVTYIMFKATGIETVFITHFFFVRLSKCIYFYSHVMADLARKQNELYSKFSFQIYNNVVPIAFLIQILSCAMYKAGCPTPRQDSSCRVGSWVWMTFKEYDVYDKPVVDATTAGPFNRWITTIYWTIKIITCFNNANMLPYFTSSKTVACIDMFCGMQTTNIVTALVTTAILANMRNELLLDFKAHLAAVRKLVGHLKCSEKILETKRLIYTKFGSLAIPGLYEAEDHLEPMDRIIVKGKSLESLVKFLPQFYSLPATMEFKLSFVTNRFEYVKGQVITQEGTMNAHSYMIQSGTCEISKNGQHLGYLEAGQQFNTLEFFAKTESKYTVKAATNCDISDWKYGDIEQLFEEYLCWNFLPGVMNIAKSKLAKLEIKPKNVKIAEPEIGGIDPNSSMWISYSIFRTIRIFLHALLTTTMFSYYGKSNVGLNAIMLIFDILAIVDIVMCTMVSRQNSTTNMFYGNAAKSKEIYFSQGLVWDCIGCFIPIIAGLISPHNPLALLRLMQVRQSFYFFEWLRNSVDISGVISFTLWSYYQIIFLFCASTVMFSLAQYEAKYETVDKNIEIPLYAGTTRLIYSGSWIGVAHSDGAFNDLTFDSAYHLMILGLYFISDCICIVGTGHMYPRTFPEKIVELCIEIIGWLLFLIIAAEFTAFTSVKDKIRQTYEMKYNCLRQFIQNCCQDVNVRITDNILVGFRETWLKKTGDFQSITFKALPHCLIREACTEIYGEFLEPIFENNKNALPKAAQHARVLATTPKTYVVKINSISEESFIVKAGTFKLIDAAGNDTYLSKGDFYIPNKKITKSVFSIGFGQLIIIPTVFMNSAKHDPRNFAVFPTDITKDKIKIEDDDRDAFIDIHIVVIFAGIFSFLSTVHALVFVPRADKTSDGSVTAAMLVFNNRMNAVLQLTIVWILIKKCTFRFHHKHWVWFNKVELLIIVASLPIRATLIKAIVRFLWYFVLILNYQKLSSDLSVNIFPYRIVNFLLAIFSIAMVYAIILIRTICSQGECIPNSMASQMYKIFDADSVQVKEIDDYTVTVDMYYLVIGIFTTTGFGNILPQTPFTTLVMSLVTMTGKYLMVIFLGISNNITGAARSSSVCAYSALRNRMKYTLRKLNVKGFSVDYFIGYLDAQFLRTSLMCIEDLTSPNILSKSVRDDFYFSLYKEAVRGCGMFNDMSIECLREICTNATKYENYYAGHVIQSQGTPIDSAILLLNGSVMLGTKTLAIGGDSIYHHHFNSGTDAQLSEVTCVCFSRSDLVRVNREKLLSILEDYPEDGAIFKKNVAAMKQCGTTKCLPVTN